MPIIVQSSTQYKDFEMTHFNRDVRKIKALTSNMQVAGWTDADPMHVEKSNAKGKKYKIIRGHHRFTVAKALGIPVKFVVCEPTGLSIHDFERATNTWSMRDYLVSFCREGRAEYKKALLYHEETGIAVGNCVALLGGHTASSGTLAGRFKRGKFKIRDMKHARAVADLVRRAKLVGIHWAASSAIVNALSRSMRAEGFNLNRLQSGIDKYGADLMKKQPNAAAYMMMVENLYNHHRATRIPLAFLADEAIRRRRREAMAWTGASVD